MVTEASWRIGGAQCLPYLDSHSALTHAHVWELRPMLWRAAAERLSLDTYSTFLILHRPTHP